MVVMGAYKQLEMRSTDLDILNDVETLMRTTMIVPSRPLDQLRLLGPL